VAEYGRYDDLLVLLGTPCEKNVIKYFKTVLANDLTMMERGEPVSLLAKWLPSINTSSKEQVEKARFLAKAFGMKYAGYRRTISSLRSHIDIIESRLCRKDYSFDYEKQPSKALFKYRRAFIRNDNTKYVDFINRVKERKAVLKTGSLYPYDIIRSCENSASEEAEILDATWNSLKNYTDGRNALAVVDGSGSMYADRGNVRPIDVALSLGIYFAEHNNGVFKNHFITFSLNPQLVEIKGADIVEKVKYCMTFNEVLNTDIMKTFIIILQTAIDNNVPQEEMPEMLYIISDMEFDSCTCNSDKTAHEAAKGLYQAHGYRLPQVIFWNVDSRNEQQPVKKNETGTALVSGMSPIIFEMVMGGDVDPYSFMLSILNKERYAMVQW